MKIQIKSRWDCLVLFEVEADSVKLALEIAVKSRADLSRANLSGANLSGANPSGADLRGANLYGEKLTKNPVQVLGLNWWICITEKHIQIGCQIHKAEKWFLFDDNKITEMH